MDQPTRVWIERGINYVQPVLQTIVAMQFILEFSSADFSRHGGTVPQVPNLRYRIQRSAAR